MNLSPTPKGRAHPVLAQVSLGYSEPKGTFPRVTHPSATPTRRWAFDLHVLSLPPAFVLSQDQTLRLNEFVLAPVTLSIDEVTPSMSLQAETRTPPTCESLSRTMNRQMPHPTNQTQRPGPSQDTSRPRFPSLSNNVKEPTTLRRPGRSMVSYGRQRLAGKAKLVSGF
jgi:hypothetical protein